MEITFLGHSSFLIKGKVTSVVTDPFDPDMVGLKFPKVEADIVTISHSHSDHNRADLVSNVKKVINGPGEYEIAGVSILGFSSFHDDSKGSERGRNTIYVIEIDGIRVAHLGDLGHELPEDTIGDMGDIDVLLIPVGGVYTLDATRAVNVTKAIEPHIVIPMHYKIDGMKEAFATLTTHEPFVSQMGLAHSTLSKLIVRDSISFDEEQKLVLLEQKA